LIAEYAPQYLNVATTNGKFAKGEGVKMGRSIGASLIDMDKVICHRSSQRI
jgi:succinate dehydrogenase/fumarate reductase flavoprotein subunit